MMAFVKVLLTTAFSQGFRRIPVGISKEKAMDFLGNGGGWIGSLHTFGLIGLLNVKLLKAISPKLLHDRSFRCISFILAVVLLMMSIFIWLIDF
ncbi:hypothetical protein PO124_04610 [Bacillus licheniformis]|nr:hypothetical protein [Bacillus licheniformis]